MIGRRTNDDGSAIVEFLALGVLLLVPLVYLVAVFARLQAASFAVEGAARDAARLVAAAPERSTQRSVEAITQLALHDQGLTDLTSQTHVRCQPSCTAADAAVTVSVSVAVPLPGVPLGLNRVLPARVPVKAQAHTRADRFG